MSPLGRLADYLPDSCNPFPVTKFDRFASAGFLLGHRKEMVEASAFGKVTGGAALELAAAGTAEKPQVGTALCYWLGTFVSWA